MTHGKRGSKAYEVWDNMKQRCLNKNNTRYHDYGGRGITVCARWMKFINFYKDMGDPPRGKQLDRINNDKGYCKKNCRWSTRKEQGLNKRMFKNKTSKYKYVYYGTREKRWIVSKKINGKNAYFGRFKTEKEAGLASDRILG